MRVTSRTINAHEGSGGIKDAANRLVIESNCSNYSSPDPPECPTTGLKYRGYPSVPRLSVGSEIGTDKGRNGSNLAHHTNHATINRKIWQKDWPGRKDTDQAVTKHRDKGQHDEDQFNHQGRETGSPQRYQKCQRQARLCPTQGGCPIFRY